jgi:hypothetical protein
MGVSNMHFLKIVFLMTHLATFWYLKREASRMAATDALKISAFETFIAFNFVFVQLPVSDYWAEATHSSAPIFLALCPAVCTDLEFTKRGSLHDTQHRPDLFALA